MDWIDSFFDCQAFLTISAFWNLTWPIMTPLSPFFRPLILPGYPHFWCFFPEYQNLTLTYPDRLWKDPSAIPSSHNTYGGGWGEGGGSQHIFEKNGFRRNDLSLLMLLLPSLKTREKFSTKKIISNLNIDYENDLQIN
jgi:hypothetical protein